MGCVAFVTIIFPLITFLLGTRELQYVICGGLKGTVACSVLLAVQRNIIGGPPLGTSQSVWRYGPKKSYIDSTVVTSVVSTCATVTATESDADNF